MSDQFTRFLCAKCGEAGHDSWNKAAHDGINWHGNVPNPLIYSDECHSCGWPSVVAWGAPGEGALAIYGPDAETFAYEDEAMARIEKHPEQAVALEYSAVRDGDWSGGCLAARGQLQ
jgi:hypothetical protein